uniref:Uncharacterized protein n=1 Tax=Trichinella nativa TaxID=6335 RepID=A0A0V1KJ09_9BILA
MWYVVASFVCMAKSAIAGASYQVLDGVFFVFQCLRDLGDPD